MTTNRLFRPMLLGLTWLLLGAFAGSALADPPDRVARVSFLRGHVSFQPAGDDQWTDISLNRPLVTGDRVYADRDSRVELQIGTADVRLDEGTTFNLLNLDDSNAQIELTEGTLNLHVRRMFDGQSYEIDTPTLAFVVDQPGDYRIDIAPQGDSTMVTVFDGSGNVYGENNASYSVRAGNSYKFHDSALRDYEVLDVPRGNEFDEWCQARNQRYDHVASRNYVSEDMIGYADLDGYGDWRSEPDYGSVWYPTSVEAGWTPYRYGHWSWIDPWGWTWVDNAPWGFAPFHYGRWVYVGSRWGWCPGPRHVRPIYAPALVGFVGGSGWGVGIRAGGPVGWFPLGPRDVYVPWYRASRSYFTNINVRNTRIINNTYITNVYNDYSRGRPISGVRYAYRDNVAAVTAVPRDVFVGARPIAASRVRINDRELRGAQVVSRVGIAPERASFAPNAARARPAPPAALDRRVIARTAPPAAPAPIATRIRAIERNGAQPLATNQLREIAARPSAGSPNATPAMRSRVQVVGQGASARPQPLPQRGSVRPGQRDSIGNATRGSASTRATTPAAPALRQTGQPSQQRGALPSARFAPREDSLNRMSPQPQRIERSNANTAAPRARSDTLQRSETRSTTASPRHDVPVQRSSRSEPTQRYDPGASAQQPRYTPRTTAPQVQQQRSEPTQRYDPGASAQQPRYAPRTTAPQVQQQRSEPTQRYDPGASAQQPRYTPRATAPQEQQRSAPQARSMLQQQRGVQQAAPQPRAAPAQQQRAAPAKQEGRGERGKKKDKDKDNDRR